jgi:precorrin-4 methylase
MAQTMRFKRKFKPLTVEIEGKDEAVHRFETVAITRSVERKLGETLERIGETEIESAAEAIDSYVAALLEQVDEVIVPEKGKKTPASKVLRELWEDDEIESRDIEDFLKDLAEKRRPT